MVAIVAMKIMHSSPRWRRPKRRQTVALCDGVGPLGRSMVVVVPLIGADGASIGSSMALL
jgi:hypothetical protein